ncbi:MAG TPA: hypothetical protein VFE72_00300 [Lysobacter sp.]|nr:hypothetical protein [Lysobacter sp.]
MADELRSLGMCVVGPVPSVASALAMIASNEPIEGAILDLNLGGEWAYPVAARLERRGVPYVFWTGYDYLPIPDAYRAASVAKPAGGIELIDALFAAAAAVADTWADIYVDRDGEHLLVLRDRTGRASEDGLRWLGAALLDRAAWSRTLRVRLEDGVFYRVPHRYAIALRVSLDLLG